MQFVARLHTPRKDVDPLASVIYCADPQVAEVFARTMLLKEPVGAFVEVSERVEIPRKQYVKEKVNNEIGITQIECVVSRDVERTLRAGKESSSKADAGEK